MMPTPAVSIVIPTRDKPERLTLALHALSSQRIGGSFEIIVVADDCTHDVADLLVPLRQRGLVLTLIKTERIGQAAARNRGAAMARGEVLLFVDDDVLLSPGYVAACYAHCRDAQDLVVRAPVYQLRYVAAFRDPETGLRYDGRPDSVRLAGERITRAMITADWPAIARKCRHRNRFERLVSAALSERPPRTPWLGCSGSGVALPRELFLAAGGYDEAFGLRWGAEAIELGYRLWRGGARFVELDGVYSAHLDHPRGDSVASFDDSFDYFFAKHRDRAIRDVQALILAQDRRPALSAAV